MPNSPSNPLSSELQVWHPVDQRLPDRESEHCEWSSPVLITTENPGYPDVDIPPGRYVQEAIYHTRLKVWMSSGEGNDLLEVYPADGKILAWMPMPEAYRG